MTDVDRLLQIMAKPDSVLSEQVAQAYTMLVSEGCILGELETRNVIGIDGVRRDIRVPPASWARRLVAAAEGGVFRRKTIEAIAAHILMTPEPVAA